MVTGRIMVRGVMLEATMERELRAAMKLISMFTNGSSADEDGDECGRSW